MSSLFPSNLNGASCINPPTQTCFDFKVSDQYMCPQVGGPKPTFVPEHAPRCHYPAQNIGQNIVCNNEVTPVQHQTQAQAVALPQPTRKVEAGFLPDRLCKEKVTKVLNQLKNNPDFTYSTNMVLEGGKGVAEYFIGNLPQILTQSGGGTDQDNMKSNMMASIVNSARSLGETAQELVTKMTVGEAVEGFINYYQGDRPRLSPSLERTLNGQLSSLKQDANLYCYLLTSLLGKVTVNDIISNCLNYVGSTQRQITGDPKLMKCINQAGGAASSLMYGDIHNMDVFTGEMVNFFDALKSTVDYLSRSFRRKMIGAGAPNRVMRSIDQIQKGLNLSLQILQYQVLNQDETLTPMSTPLITGPTIVGQDRATVPSTQVDNATTNGVVTMTGGANANDEDETTDSCTESDSDECDEILESSGGGNPWQRYGKSHFPSCPPRRPKYNKEQCIPLRSIPSGKNGHCGTHPLNVLRPFNGNITPGVYFDPSQCPIGKHPVRGRRIYECDIPDSLKKAIKQNKKKCLSCTQPHWFPNCV